MYDPGLAKDSRLGLHRCPSAQNRLYLLVFERRSWNKDKTENSGRKFAAVPDIDSSPAFRNGLDLLPSNALLERKATGSGAGLNEIVADNQTLRKPIAKLKKNKYCPKAD